MDDENLRIIRFDIWCNQCQHKDLAENESPCDECLEYPARLYSSKPEKFEEK